MATTLKAAVESYLRGKTVARGTRNEYFSTLRKWEQWAKRVTTVELGRLRRGRCVVGMTTA
jgi:hypothetical protein